jgi:hypothetical protein
MRHDLRPLMRPRAPAALAIGFACLLGAAPASAVTINVYNADSPGEGFNSNTGRTPAGGNPGTTLGAQRRFVMEYAADVWSARLGGGLPILFTARFDPLGGDTFFTTLGYAAPTTLHVGFQNAPFAQTWYPAALANQLYETDINDLVPGNCPSFALPLVNGKCPDLYSKFNSDVDGSVVLGTRGFYYGIDGKGGNDIDFLSVVLHEMAHGLGLLDLIDPSSGRIWTGEDNCTSCSDAYTNNLENPNFSPKKLSQMTNNQRLDSIVDTGELVWVGPALRAISGKLTTGRRASDGAVQIYAPSQYEQGSSVAHLSTAVSPNELMEPAVFNPPQRDLEITLAMFDDIGWETIEVASCGDANEDGNLSSSDALVALAAAVGSSECDDLVCDVNLGGGVTTTDALLILKRAVGQTVTLTCPLA